MQRLARLAVESDSAKIASALSSDPSQATLTASRALLGVIARSLSEALELVTLPQFRVLVILASSGAMRMGALARRVHATPSTFTRSVDRMEKQGWVHREHSPDSRREVLIHLTPPGAQLVAHVTDRRRAEITAILGRLNASDQDAVAHALALFAVAAGEQPPDDLIVLGI